MRLTVLSGSAIAAACALLPFFSALAEEKNGLSVNVSKKTLDRADVRSGYIGYSDRIDRTQGLKVAIKNTSFKPMPDGEIEWTILVRRYYSTAILSYQGKEALKALKPAEAAELTIGAAQILGWRDASEQTKDKIEYQVIVNQAGKEMIRVESTASFDTLKKRATPAPKRGE